MSNYPPGVTGNEFEIAGPQWEDTVERVCEAQDVSVRVIERDVADAIKHWQQSRKTDDEARAQQSMLWMLRDALVDDFDAEQCQFEGKVDAWGYGGVTHWTCPKCGTEHEEEPDEDEVWWPEDD